MSTKQDRHGARTATDLERKYNFGKQFAEILGIALDANEKVDSVESTLRNEILEQYTSIIRDAESIFMTALESYVETADMEDYKSTLKTELELWASGISARVTATESSIENVNGDLQEKFNTITKYFTFDIDGLTIGQADNPNKVVIDNDEITIYVDGKPIQEFKSDGSSLIPMLKVTTNLNLLGLVIDEDETHINCGYVG